LFRHGYLIKQAEYFGPGISWKRFKEFLKSGEDSGEGEKRSEKQGVLDIQIFIVEF
jgi:hypothetical protein